MKNAFLVLITFLTFIASAQQDPILAKNTNYAKVLQAIKEGDFDTAISLSPEIIDKYYEDSRPYMSMAVALRGKEQYKKAYTYFMAAYEIEPFLEINSMNALNTAFNNNDGNLAGKILKDFSFFPRPPANFDGQMNYLRNNIDHYKKYESTRAMAIQMENAVNKHVKDAPANMKFFWEEAYPLYSIKAKDIVEGNPADFLEKLRKITPKVAAGTFPLSYYNQILVGLSRNTFWNKWEASKIFLPDLKEQFSNPKTSTFMRLRLFLQLEQINQINRKYEEIITLSNIMLDELRTKSLSTSMNVEVASKKIFALVQLTKYKEAYALAKQVLPLLPQVKNQTTKMGAYYNVSRALAYGGDKAKGVQIAKEGVDYMYSVGGENHQIFGKALPKALKELQLFNNEKVEEAISIDENDAISLYNNALIKIKQRKYNDAATYLSKAKDLYEKKIVNAKEEDRKELLGFYAKIGSSLVASYKESKQDAKIFPVMESLKSNALIGFTGKRIKRASLEEIQQVLKPDEALIYYTDVTLGFTYEGVYMAAVITKNDIHYKYINTIGALMVQYVSENKELGNIEQELAKREFRQPKYTQYASLEEAGMNQFKKGDFTLLINLYRKYLNPTEGGKLNENYTDKMKFNMLSNSFWVDLIKNIEPYFKDKKRLIFCPDGELNFLPFETFKNLNQAYLIEKYDIGYIPSGSVLHKLRSAPNTSYPKNVLAFGDAKYSKLAHPGKTLNSIADIDRLALDVKASLQKNEPLDYAFATFSKTAMHYLEGAKREVLAIQAIVPKTDLKLDSKMTENEFKRMSKNGELKNYKVIHLSSHASVHPYVFDLSGIAFSVFSTPQNGEDGILTVSEMSKLAIKTDLMFLSACQTGLGKIVPGDGILGLNQSMLQAGAKATITTLWSVNDYGTSVFTQKLYEKIFKDKKEYIEAVSEVKRAFLNGEYNQHANLTAPMYWAPFVYYGN